MTADPIDIVSYVGIFVSIWAILMLILAMFLSIDHE